MPYEFQQVKIHRITEREELLSTCEAQIGTLIKKPKIGGRVHMFLPRKPKGRIGFISTKIQNIVTDGTWMTIETIGGIFILEVIENGQKS